MPTPVQRFQATRRSRSTASLCALSGEQAAAKGKACRCRRGGAGATDGATELICKARSICAALSFTHLPPIVSHQSLTPSCMTRREQCLKNAGFKDIFKVVKDKENVQALQHLPSVLKELDAQEQATARCGQV